MSDRYMKLDPVLTEVRRLRQHLNELATPMAGKTEEHRRIDVCVGEARAIAAQLDEKLSIAAGLELLAEVRDDGPDAKKRGLVVG
jgi:hypothetical protein